MDERPYTRFHRQELTLRDELAVDRTVLANERTLLAYVRTALGFLILGLTFLHFLEQAYLHVVGYAFMLIGATLLIVGCVRFFQVRMDLTRLRKMAADVQPEPPATQDRPTTGNR